MVELVSKVKLISASVLLGAAALGVVDWFFPRLLAAMILVTATSLFLVFIGVTISIIFGQRSA